MRLLPERPNWSLALVVLMAVLVAAVALLQYRWVGQLTADRRLILESRLDNSTAIFRRWFTTEWMDLATILRPEFPRFRTGEQNRRPEEPEIDIAGNFSRWKKSTNHAQLVTNVFMFEGKDTIARLDPGGFVIIADHEPMRSAVEACRETGDPATVGRRNWAWRIARTGSDVYLWRHLGPRPGFMEPSRDQGIVVLQVNSQYVWRVMVPELLDRAFVDRDKYDIAIVESSSSGSRAVLFGSENALKTEFKPDVRRTLFAAPAPPPGEGRPVGRRVPQLFSFCGDTQDWEIWIRHSAGSVSAEVSRFRVRNLILSGAVLLLLSSSIVLLVLSNRRAHQLAAQQMAFAAGISHELRTPLAVIRSAADNLADGAVTDASSVREHGTLIQEESRRLTTMVEDILSYAAAQSGRQRIDIKPVDVTAVVRDAIRNVEKAAIESGVRLEEHIDDGLPRALADPHALSRCVQNLITNAIKYAAEGKWVGVYATSNKSQSAPAVLIQICDRGPGIRSEDLPRIFEPFYQGRVKKGRKGGVGLGLSLTRNLMRAMRGDVTATSAPGSGACFTLSVPLAIIHEQTNSAG